LPHHQATPRTGIISRNALHSVAIATAIGPVIQISAVKS